MSDSIQNTRHERCLLSGKRSSNCNYTRSQRSRFTRRRTLHICKSSINLLYPKQNIRFHYSFNRSLDQLNQSLTISRSLTLANFRCILSIAIDCFAWFNYSTIHFRTDWSPNDFRLSRPIDRSNRLIDRNYEIKIHEDRAHSFFVGGMKCCSSDKKYRPIASANRLGLFGRLGCRVMDTAGPDLQPQRSECVRGDHIHVCITYVTIFGEKDLDSVVWGKLSAAEPGGIVKWCGYVVVQWGKVESGWDSRSLWTNRVK